MDISNELRERLWRAKDTFDKNPSKKTATEYLHLLTQEQAEISRHLGSIPAANIPAPSSSGGAVVELRQEATQLAKTNQAEQARARASLNET